MWMKWLVVPRISLINVRYALLSYSVKLNALIDSMQKRSTDDRWQCRSQMRGEVVAIWRLKFFGWEWTCFLSGDSLCLLSALLWEKFLNSLNLGVFSETFYALAWSTLTVGGEKTNILASGGIRGEVRLFHPERKVRIPVLVNLIPMILSSLIMG